MLTIQSSQSDIKLPPFWFLFASIVDLSFFSDAGGSLVLLRSLADSASLVGLFGLPASSPTLLGPFYKSSLFEVFCSSSGNEVYIYCWGFCLMQVVHFFCDFTWRRCIFGRALWCTYFFSNIAFCWFPSHHRLKSFVLLLEIEEYMNLCWEFWLMQVVHYFLCFHLETAHWYSCFQSNLLSVCYCLQLTWYVSISHDVLITIIMLNNTVSYFFRTNIHNIGTWRTQ